MADINRFSSVTPMMRRYFEIKQKFPDALVFYRLGDFFELFYDDAKVVSSLLDLTLTRRNSNSDDPIPMAGVPYQSADGYIAKLIKQGRSVVVCDQVGEKNAKGMMERKVTRIITPGTVTDENMLSDNEDKIIACVFEEQGVLGLSTLSISSGRYTASEFNSFAGLSLMLSKLNPAELLYPERFKFYQGIQGIICRKALPLWEFSYDTCYASLCKQFRTRSLNGFGIEKLHAGVCAAGALLCYVKNTQSTPIEHVRSICLEDYSSFVVIDKTARKNLELTETLSGDHDASLFDIIDKTSTPMGSRQLRSMLVNPLRNNAEVERRLDLVESLQHTSHSVELMALLQAMGDLERIVARIGLRKAQPRDLSTLRDAIKLLPQLKSLLRAGTSQDIPPVAISSARTSRCAQPQATADSTNAPSAEAVTSTATAPAPAHAHESLSAEHATANGMESSAADAERSAANAMRAAASAANAESSTAGAESSEVASSASAAAISTHGMAATCSESTTAVSEESSSATTSSVHAVAQSDARSNTSTAATTATAPSAGADEHAAVGGDMRNAVDRDVHGGIGTSSKAAVGNDTYAAAIGHAIQATVGMNAVDSASADISILSSSTVVRTTGDAIFVTDAAVSAVEALASGDADASASAASTALATATVSSGALAASSSHSATGDDSLTLSASTQSMSASGTAVESTATTMQARSIAPSGLSSVAAVATGNTMPNAMEATAAKAIDNASHVSASDAMSVGSATHSAKAAYHAMDESSSDWAKDLIVSSAATYAISGTIAHLKPSHSVANAAESVHAAASASAHATASTTAPTTTMAASTAAAVAVASATTATDATATDVARNAASDTANAATEANGLSTTSTADDGAKAVDEAEANHLTHHSTGKAGDATAVTAADDELEASTSQSSKSYAAANTTMAKGMTVDSRANTDKDTKHYADDDANWNASVRIYDHSDADSTQSGHVCPDSHSNRLCDSNHYQSGAVSHPLGNATDAAESASAATAAVSVATASASASASESSAFASALAPTATTQKLGYSNKDLLHATTTALASRNADEDDSEIITEIELAQMHRAFEHACNSSLAFSANKRVRALSSLLSPESIDKVNKAFSANCGSPVIATVMVPPLKKRTSKSDSSKQGASSSSIAISTSSSGSGSGSSSVTDAQSKSNALAGHKAETESNSCSCYSSGSGKASTTQSANSSVADSSVSVATGAMATTASGEAEHAQSSARNTNTSTDAIDAEHVASAANTAMTAEDAQAEACTSVDKASSQAMAKAAASADTDAVANAHDLSGATAVSDNQAKDDSAADGDACSASVSEEGIGAGIGADTVTDSGTDADASTGSDADASTNVGADEATDVDAGKAKGLAGGHTTCTSNCSLSECISGDDNADMGNEHETTSSSTAATATDVGDEDKSEGSLKCSVSTHAKATGTASGTDTARISKGSTTSATATAITSGTGKKHLATHSKATTAKSQADGLSKDAVAVASGDCSSSADGRVSGDGSCPTKSTVASKKKSTRSKSKARVSKANAVAPTRASITATDTHGEHMPAEHAHVHDECDAHQLDCDGATEGVKRSSRGGNKKRSNKDKHSESESNSSKSTTNTACSESSATCGSQALSSSAMSTEDKSIVSQALNSDESSELGAHDADSMHYENEGSAVEHKSQAIGLDEHEASEHMDGDAISDTDSKTEVVADMDSFDYDDEELDPSAVIEAIAQAAEKLIEAEDELAETAEEDALEQAENLHPITIDGERALRASEIEALENAHEEEALARARARAGTATSASTSASMATSSSAADPASAESSASARASDRASTAQSVKDSTRVTTDTDAASASDSHATETASISTTASTGVAVDEAAATNKAADSGAEVDAASASSAIAQMDATATAQGTDSLAAASQADNDSDAVSTTNTVATHASCHSSSSDMAHDGDTTAHSSATADVSAVDDVTAVCDVSASVDDTMDTADAGEAQCGSKSICSTGVAHSQSKGADDTHNQSNAAEEAVAQSNGSDAGYVQGTDESEATCSGSSNSTNAGKRSTAGTATCDSSNNGPASGSDTCTSADADTVAEARADSGSMSRTGMDSEACAVSGGHSGDSSYSGESSGGCSSSSGGDLSDAEANSSCSGLSDDEANAGGMGKFDTVLKQRAEMLPDLDDVLDLLLKSINETPSATLRDGDVIANGYSKELDELRDLQSGSENTLLKIEAREKMRTGINSLKVRFNSVHGYYIEVSKAYSDKVPADYIRRQTLKNTERYITEELKELEDKTISAKTRALQLEKQIYDMLIEELIKYLPDLSCFAHNIALLDSSFALAKTAKAHHFVRPQLSDENIIKIVNGRHPVVEAIADRPFVANSIELRDGHNLAVISGPNMGGKSTFMRQVALISILARMGSFVPAQSAVIGDIDRIFTRIGASDDLASGRSTFMVEMEETATILNNATEHSLVIMDEVGRGTSGAEGAAIAEAIVQYLAKSIHPKTLFATHYTEVTTLVEIYPNAFNLCFNALKIDDNIVFLYQAQEGRQDRSFGIEVAKLAGIPANITKNAIGFYIARSKDLASTALSSTTAFAQLSNGHTQTAAPIGSTASPSIAATASTGDATSASAEMATAAEAATDATAANASAAIGAGAAVGDGAIQSSSATHAHGAIDTMALASQAGAGADARAGTDAGARANDRADAVATAIAQDDAGDGYSDSGSELDEAIALYGNIMSESVAQISQRLVTTQAHLIESKAQKETLEIELSKTQELMNFIKGIELENLSPLDAVALLGTLRERAYAV